jgi:nucleoside-diphosphate-sugar epimerase
MSQTYFVTGAQGCIGAWVVKTIVEQGDAAVLFDLEHHDRRLTQVLKPEQLNQVQRVCGDVGDFETVHRAMAENQTTAIIHLAGLQVPFCKADPVKGARVNVLGTLNVFEAARKLSLQRLVYASSAAVYDAAEGLASVNEAVVPHPNTHYGVFKLANEGNARVYAQDFDFCSVGLRPLTIYGLARDQGLTSDPTRALKAAALGRPFKIGFSGPTDFLYVADAARAFVRCATVALPGAQVFNLHGQSLEVAEFVAQANALLPAEYRDLIQIDGPVLPIAPCLDESALQEMVPNLPKTSLKNGLQETLDFFRNLHAENRLPMNDIAQP